MTRDEIIKIAWDCGILMGSQKFQEGPTKLEQFAERIAAAEREACAKVCESLITDGDIYPGNFVLEACAKSIRSKSE